MKQVKLVNKLSTKATSKDQEEILKLRGKAHYARVHHPDDDGKFTLSLELLRQEDVDLLASHGIDIYNKDEKLEAEGKSLMGTYVTLRSNYAPIVTDANKNPVPKDIAIGNGSLINVLSKPYRRKRKAPGYSDIGLGLQA